eukprot:328097-Pyramimonas_sp.AAC.1
MLVDVATVGGACFQEGRPLGVPERVWTDSNGLLVDPPTCAANDTDDDSVSRPWRARALRKHGALRAHAARTHLQNAALARAWASPDGQCHARLYVFHARAHLVDHLAHYSPRCLSILMSNPTTAVAAPGVTISGAAPCYHITPADFSAPMTGRIPGVPVSRRHVVVPTVRAAGPTAEHAHSVIATTDIGTARVEIA